MTSIQTSRPRLLTQVVVYALVGASLALSLAGCTSKQQKRPDTIKEFLSQPRPQ